MTKIQAKLANIQAALKAPKSQYNKFGNYNYRKAEDILEAVKPLLQKEGCILTCDDNLLLIGGRYYVKASVTITAVEDGSSITTNAYAREEEEKKGMDGSQVTGASSSYARKYALNGLLCIDDTADSDTTNQGNSTPAPAPKPAAKAAPAAPAASEPKKPIPLTKKTVSALSSNSYNQWVAAAASGKILENGNTAMKEFVERFQPTKEELDKFNDDVFQYLANHNE